MEAAFTDDELSADYLGGVLAASGPDDDSGVPIIAQIGRLSSLQLRMHYVMYRELHLTWPADAVGGGSASTERAPPSAVRRRHISCQPWRSIVPLGCRACLGCLTAKT